MSWLWGAAVNPQYEELVEKACSPLNLPYPQSEDMATNLEITDMIRSKAVLPKPAMQSLKRRVGSKNGRVQMYALGLVDTCIKNGGDHFLAEIASKEFVDEMSGLIKATITSAEVKQMALKMFQSWALAFKSKTELNFFVDVYNELKNSGVAFPPPPSETSSHLLDTTTAPAWVDSDVCMRCRTAFTFTNRKHHCRNCGLVFDQACSSKTMALPRYGITTEVRVCEGCWVKSGKGKSQVPSGPPPAIPGRTPRSRQDLDADLQRAIELSLAESQPSARTFVGSEPPLRQSGTTEDDDEDLRLAIEASLREMDNARPSAPLGAEEPEYKPLPTFDLAPRESETILTFSNTMDQMAAYGERDLRRFPHAHVLAEQAYALGGKLHRNAEEKSTKQQMLAEMQGKLSQAVALYGSILDGQQAYAARQLQEQQQRQYSQQQQYAPQHPYGYAPYAANPYSQANGQSSAWYAPPQTTQSPHPISNVQAGPSIYPSMPSFAPQQAQYQPLYQPQQYDAPPQASYAPPQSQTHAQWAATAQQHDQYAQPPAAQLQRQTSITYSSPTKTEATAPPPVNLASHPSSSPTQHTTALPSQPSAPMRSASYASTASHIASAPIDSPQMESAPMWNSQTAVQEQYQPYRQAQPQPPSQTSPSEQYSHLAQTSYQQQQHRQPQQQQQQQQQQQHVYSANSFPEAPAAVFPDAPSSEPAGLERKEKEEALLIEL